MKQRSKLIIIGILIFLFIAVVTLVSKNNQDKFIDIGAITPLTGTAASYGDPSGKAMIQAIDEINASGGILKRPVRLILEDGACDSKTATNAAQKLISIDKVKIILGGHCSTESLAIAPLVNNAKIIQLASLTSADAFTNAGEYSFRNWPSTDYYVAQLADIAFGKGVRSLAVLSEQKEFPLSAATSFKKRFAALGGQVVLDQQFPSDETDLKNYLLKIKNTPSVDSIFASVQTQNSAIIFFKTLQELGMLGRYALYGSNELVSQKVFDETGGMNKDVYTTNVYVNPERPKTKRFLETYKQKYGDYPKTNYFYAANSYDGVFLIKDIIEQCKAVNVECIREKFTHTKKWEGTAGSYSFDQNGDAITTIGLHYFDTNGKEIWEELK